MGDVEQQVPAGNSSGWCSCIKDANMQRASTIIRICNLLNAGLIIFAGIYSLVSISDIATLHLAALSISLYLACFGCILCCFELRVGALEKMVRRRFGFMYTFIGRTIFLFFIASFLFPRNTTTTIIVGVVTLCNAFLNCFVMWKHGEAFHDPTGKYSTAEDSTAAYVQNNPELAQRALQTGANYARENPDAAAAATRAAMSNSSANPFAASRT
uniref:Uncharacterized protein n=1 Tax=Mucochytrium quahogii TaxID=96639 RepID=A0A7S2S8X4_9STRA|mmetsp:Transcript_13669/g.22311  ORF Transcript_13669/g.22311 Transcript_13669/m.22311 type:complete len:214 (+) Transcript_13669:154-795(+)